MSPHFDPSYALEFDFGRGQIRMANAGERVVVPCDALLALCDGAGSAPKPGTRCRLAWVRSAKRRWRPSSSTWVASSH